MVMNHEEMDFVQLRIAGESPNFGSIEMHWLVRLEIHMTDPW